MRGRYAPADLPKVYALLRIASPNLLKARPILLFFLGVRAALKKRITREPL